MATYLVLGYGIPKELAADDNYRRYLGVAFNTVFAESQARPQDPVTIICCGGPTDCFPSFRRTEAQEIATFLKGLAARPSCKTVTKRWKFLLERRSLSTLENLVYARETLRDKGLTGQSVTIFCEAVRAPRVRALARRLFPGLKCHVVPTDFDLSSNRYLDPVFLKKKERAVAKLEDWALQDPAHMKKYHQAFADKLRFLREAGPERHAEALKEWWEKRLLELGEI